MSPLPLSAPIPPSTKLCLALLAVLGTALCALLWPQWRQNPDLYHGLVMPVVFLALLHTSRRLPGRPVSPGGWTAALVAILMLAGLALLAVGGLYAAMLSWSHALVIFTLTSAFVCLLGAGLLVCADESVGILPINWTSLSAVGLWWLCSPLPPGTYSNLTLGLQLALSKGLLHTLHFFGIAAGREGNIIVLTTTTVGVEDACSGIRSLLSCLFAGVFFSATLVRKSSSRALIILLAGPLALGMNFLRSLVLTLMAWRGVDIGGAWHDITGYLTLGVTGTLLALLALRLEHSEVRLLLPGPSAMPERLPKVRSFAGAMLAGGLVLGVLLVGLFLLNTHRASHPFGRAPLLAEMLPEKIDGWAVKTTNDLQRFSGILGTDCLLERTYSKETPAGPEHITIYVAYWQPGQASVSQVASHTPDACWPGSGWVAQPELSASNPQIFRQSPPYGQSRIFKNQAAVEFVWFWHFYDGRPIPAWDIFSPTQLLRIAAQYGFRHSGDQLFIRFSSNKQWAEISEEPLLRSVFSRIFPMQSASNR